jgi:hypothetical protein
MYARQKNLESYWINTSSNKLIVDELVNADPEFYTSYDKLLETGSVQVEIMLETSFAELKDNATLWGLLVNAGYLTVINYEGNNIMSVAIPNGEVRTEFLRILAGKAHLRTVDLNQMFKSLMRSDMDGFLEIYQEMILTQSSYFDEVQQENSYHMLFLGMCLVLQGIYEIDSNIEHGHGRSDIRMKSLSKERPHIIIEFKYGENLSEEKHNALRQIEEKKYYAGLTGSVLLVGIAHYKKRCELISKMVTEPQIV